MWQYDLRQSQVPTICILFVPYETATHTHIHLGHLRVLAQCYVGKEGYLGIRGFWAAITQALQPIKSWAASHPSTSANQNLGCQSFEYILPKVQVAGYS